MTPLHHSTKSPPPPKDIEASSETARYFDKHDHRLHVQTNPQRSVSSNNVKVKCWEANRFRRLFLRHVLYYVLNESSKNGISLHMQINGIHSLLLYAQTTRTHQNTLQCVDEAPRAVLHALTDSARTTAIVALPSLNAVWSC